MCDSPFLSIIVPVYNVENYIRQCLDSILAQDFSDYEVILVDDGSVDSSGAICDQYTSENPSFQCIHKPNGGHTSARKCGYEASRGQYVAFVDSDDWIAPDMYGKMCHAIQETQADIVLCNYTAVMPDRREICTMPFPAGFYDKARLEEEVYPFMIYSGVFYKYGISPNLWNKLFRREQLRDHLFHVPDEVTVGEDALTSYSCILDASSVFIMDENFYYYRSNADSLSRRTVPARRLLENHTMFQTFCDVIDILHYPYMERQLDYYFVYQCLLTYALVFKNMRGNSARRRTFLEECGFPVVHKAFDRVSIRDIAGIHNKLFAFCIRHSFFRMFEFLLRY